MDQVLGRKGIKPRSRGLTAFFGRSFLLQVSEGKGKI